MSLIIESENNTRFEIILIFIASWINTYIEACTLPHYVVLDRKARGAAIH